MREGLAVLCRNAELACAIMASKSCYIGRVSWSRMEETENYSGDTLLLSASIVFMRLWYGYTMFLPMRSSPIALGDHDILSHIYRLLMKDIL